MRSAPAATASPLKEQNAMKGVKKKNSETESFWIS
jgi:hypothetical protein